MIKKLIYNKQGNHFKLALILIFLSIAIPLFAFISEEQKITGFVAVSQDSADVVSNNLREFDNFDSLRSLSKGLYYIDGDGVVYWVDDESKPAIAKIRYIRDVQKNRFIYIDNEGNIGYILK